MPSIKQVAGKVQVEVERFDGGLNTKDSPSRINVVESPDCLNVVYDDQGSVFTREGTSYFNTSVVETGTNIIDGCTDFNGTMVIWAGGDMFRASGTTFVTVGSAQGQFSSGVKVAYEQYQSLLFMSDGTNGPFKYDGSGFYRMGIATPSAPTGASDTSGGGDIAADTYYYAVSYVNSQAVEGEVGSASVAVTLGASASVDVSSIPTGAASLGVDQRFVYRATSATGPWLFVKTLTNNTQSSFSDNVAVGSEGGNPPADATAPTPFTTIKLHKERLFFDDADDRTSVRYTSFENPFVSTALSFEPMNKGDGSNIIAIGVQDDLVSMFKSNSIWIFSLTDASDDSTWVKVKTPTNLGIVSSRGFVETENGILFMGKRNNRITGVHLLSGIDVLETNNQLLRTRSISEKIEDNILAFPSTLWDDIAMTTYNNRVYVAAPFDASSTENDAVWWFDINRLGSDGQPGSWSPWKGVVGVLDWVVHNGLLYGGSSLADGYLLQFENGTYTDADGSAIDSYFWSKEIGGEPAIESWVKDFRFINLWYERLGNWTINLRYRLGGDQGTGVQVPINLTFSPAEWDSAKWDQDQWGPATKDVESQHSVAPLLGRRIQFRFDNQNTAGRAFKFHSAKLVMNLRRERSA